MAIKPSTKDLEFTKVFKEWQETKSKRPYDKMFVMVWNCCENLGKRLLKKNGIYGARAENSADRWRDAAFDSMRKLTDGQHNDIVSLSAYCSNWVKYHMIYKKSNVEADLVYNYGLLGDHDKITIDQSETDPFGVYYCDEEFEY